MPGDVLFAMYGATIGKVAILAKEAVTNQAVVGCTPFDGVFNKYLLKFLIAQRPQFHQASEGGAQPNVSKEKVVRCPFPLPPLAEQHRIVAKVDELMAMCDRLEAAQQEREERRDRLNRASLHRLNNGADADAFRNHARFHLRHFSRLTTRPEHIRELRQTILNLAVRGKLVPQNPNDEPASELLTKVRDERRKIWEGCELAKRAAAGKTLSDDNWKTKYIDANGLVTETPFTLPKAWKWVPFAQVAGNFQYGPRFAVEEYAGDGIPTVRTTDMDFRGQVSLDQAPKVRIPAQAEDHWCLRQDDLLITRTGATIGKCALYRQAWGKAIASAYLIRFRLTRKSVFPRFVLRYLLSPVGQGLLLSGSTAMAQPNVNATSISGFPFPLPPFDEQKRIVAKVDELMKLCDHLESQLTTTQTESRRLLEAVLHEALATAEDAAR
jgi:type I restriction enzyme S subunit